MHTVPSNMYRANMMHVPLSITGKLWFIYNIATIASLRSAYTLRLTGMMLQDKIWMSACTRLMIIPASTSIILIILGNVLHW